MKQDPSNPCLHGKAFSLVEVVLSLGIVSFALLAIFAMFGSSLRSVSETISQQEVLGITRTLGDFLGSTNASYGVGYSTVSNWVAAPDSAPGLFAFVTINGTVTMGSSSADTNRGGRLFRIVPTLSSNVPGITGAADLASNAFIPLQVKIYEVPAAATDISRLMPFFTYETSVFR